jgi:hypothetical protein
MRRRAAFIYLVFSLVLVQISGLHLHMCAGEEESRDHPAVHYADDGLFFGENHVQDDHDDLEVSLPAATFTTSSPGQHQPDPDSGFTALLFVIPEVDAPSAVVAYAAPDTTNYAALSSRPFETPPARGPPSRS